MTVRGGIRPKDQAVLFQYLLQIIENQSRLNACQFLLRVDLDHAIHVFGEIDDHSNVAALPCQTGAAAATCDRRSVLPAEFDRSDYVAAIARDHYANRNLAVVRTVSRIKGAVAIAEADFATNVVAKVRFECIDVDVCPGIHSPFRST